MIITPKESSFQNVFEALPIGCSLDLLRTEIHQKRNKKCCKLNSKRSLVNKGLITKKSKLTKKGKGLVSEL